MRPTFDDRDKARLETLEAEYNQVQGPRVGDYVHMADGTLRRFTHDWGQDIQTTSHTFAADRSFYFGGAYVSFSGSLDPGIPKAGLEPTEETKLGRFWFFHHNDYKADNGVAFEIMVRVFKQKGLRQDEVRND